MRHFIFVFALLFMSAPALADRASDCRRQCGDDAACYRGCMGYSYRPSYYGYPSGGGGHPHAYRRAPSSLSAPRTAPQANAPKAEPPTIAPRAEQPTIAPRAEPQAPKAQRPAASRSSDRSAAARPSILGTAYDFLYAPGAETAGYGLYSYVIVPRPSDRAVAFLRELVGRFPAASDVAEAKQRINVLYIPTKAGARGQAAFPADVESAAIKTFLDKNYDFALAQRLLFHLCDKPAPAVAQLCENDLSGGPYILTYATKISDLSPLPPPFLFVDLTNVRPRAFPLFVAAYAAQVKRPEFSDGARLADFHLQLANIVLTAADWVQPVSAAVADIAHFAEAKKSDGEAPK
ncbi:hypothetical protein [Methylocystis sp. B8]|uniref:hypothetical protein n=1 Tax=Methylocystis sp. B8 TaxID=544938 RepID=UPI0010FE7F57|nr:hypothetical protein [Methylocystis sp. B8]TLG77937.1 hypothetical protein FEV16_05035 [Methylocystis sp. B8]